MRLAICAVVLALACSVAGADDNKAGHLRPAAPAARHFPADFPRRADHEWTDWLVGGIGGAGRSVHSPVVFVHGNNSDAGSWYPVIARLRAKHGYAPGELWALSYNGVGCANDSGVFTYNTGPASDDRSASTGCVVTGNEQNVADLADFISDVLAYTKAQRVSIVAHSLGVTVARRTMRVHPELAARVAGFVSIAGGNHGTSLCPPGSEANVESCDEIAAGTPWLAALNAGGEAPGPTRWMTVYDSSGAADPAFAGPTYAESPRLEGAEANCRYPGFYHNDLRIDPRIVDQYAAFLLSVETGATFACPAAPAPSPPG